MGLFSGHNPELAARLARVERKLDAIMTSLGIALESDGMDDIRALASAGKKIEAIRLYRARTGAGLAEAKAAVDSGL